MSWLSLGVAIAAVILTYVESRRRRAGDKERLAVKLVADAGPPVFGDPVTQAVKVRNVGHGPAENVHVWLAERVPDGTPEGVLSSLTQQHRVGVLTRDDGWVEFGFSYRPAGSGAPRTGAVVGYWTDSEGEHRDQDIGRPGITVLV